MPIYEFICQCGNQEERLLAISKRKEPQKCKECGKEMDRVLANKAGFVFKGSGFYETDYKHGRSLKKQMQKEKKWRKENVD